jgi:hypothetical protein
VDFQVTAPRIGYITEVASVAQVGEDVLRVGEHVHQVRNRRALVAGDVADAGLQQRLGDGQNALAAKLLAGGQLEVLHLPGKRSLSHRILLRTGKFDPSRNTLSTRPPRLDRSRRRGR